MEEKSNYLFVSVTFKDGSEAQNFVIYETEIEKAKREAARWAGTQFGDRVKDIIIDAKSHNPQLAVKLINKSNVIPT